MNFLVAGINKGLGIPKESGLEGQWDLIIGLPVKKRLDSSLEAATTIAHQHLEEGAVTHKGAGQNYLLSVEDLL